MRSVLRFTFYGLFVFALSGGFGFLLPLYAGLFVMLSLAKLGKDTGTGALPFEATKSTVKRLAFSDFYFCHSFPSLRIAQHACVCKKPINTLHYTT